MDLDYQIADYKYVRLEDGTIKVGFDDHFYGQYELIIHAGSHIERKLIQAGPVPLTSFMLDVDAIPEDTPSVEYAGKLDSFIGVMQILRVHVRQHGLDLDEKILKIKMQFNQIVGDGLPYTTLNLFNHPVWTCFTPYRL